MELRECQDLFVKEFWKQANPILFMVCKKSSNLWTSSPLMVIVDDAFFEGIFMREWGAGLA